MNKPFNNLCILAVVLICGLCSGCSIETYELKKLADECGGIDKVHEIYFDAWELKAICTDGTIVGL